MHGSIGYHFITTRFSYYSVECLHSLLLDHDVKPIPEPSEYDKTQFINSGVFLDYSAKHWVTHLRESQAEITESLVQLIFQICDADSARCEAWLKTYWLKTGTAFPQGLTTLMVLSYFGLQAAVETVLSTMKDDAELNAQDKTYGRSALSWAAGNGFGVIVQMLAQGHPGWKRRIALLLFGNKAEINSMDAYGRTPLMYAIWNGNVAAVQTLLIAGARIDLTDEIGGTPLFYAMSHKKEALVKLLLKHGATPKPTDKMDNCLFFTAVKKGDVQVIQLFLDSGMDIESKDVKCNHKTALLLAVEKRHLDVIRLLLRQGANVESRGLYKSETPLLTAIKNRDSDIVQLLLYHGASVEAFQEANLRLY